MSKAIVVQPPGGFDRVVIEDKTAQLPGPGEITVRLHANSLNYHDYAVVSGMWGPSEPRIPMADGAGVVETVGPDVTEFRVGDHVVSTFFPTWLDGQPEVDGFATVPGMASTATLEKWLPRRKTLSPTHPAATAMPRRRPCQRPL